MEKIENALYLVATPIGNLGDISYRAVNILKDVNLIAAEDTRTSSVLMNYYGINTPLQSYHSHNIPTQTPKIIERLKAGDSVALISDAGTPAISDPGYNLVCACVESKIRVIPIPGASAFISCLISSGLPTQRFVFEGFLPHKKGRKSRIESLIDEQRTIIFYESPHRIHKTIKQLSEAFGERRCVIGREITKKFEEFIHGTLTELAESLIDKKVRGELVIVIEGKKEKKEAKNKYRLKEKNDL